MSVNLTNGQAVRQDFVAQRTNALITGSVTGGNNRPLSNIGVYAFATINGLEYEADTATGTNGGYSLGVINGTGQVGLSGQDLSEPGYSSVNNQTVFISNANRTANFVAANAFSSHLIGRGSITPARRWRNMNIFGFANSGGNFSQSTTDGKGNFNLGLNAGTWTVQLNNDPNSGTPAAV